MKIEIDDKMAAKLVKLAKTAEAAKKAGAEFTLTSSEKLLAVLADAVKAARKGRREQTNAKCKAYRAAAITQYGSEGEIEVDSGALVSLGPDDGAYVQAWVWVYN